MALALPAPGPRLATVLRLFFVLLGALALILFALGSVIFWQEASARGLISEYGISPGRDGTLGAGIGNPLSAEAEQAGLAPRQQIVSINGVPLPPDGDLQAVAALLSGGGQAADLVMNANDGTRFNARLTRSAEHATEGYGGLLTFNQGLLIVYAVVAASCALSLFASILLLRRRPRDPVSLLYVFIALVFAGNNPIADPAALQLGLLPASEFLDLVANISLICLAFIFPDGKVLSWRWAILMGVLVIYMLAGISGYLSWIGSLGFIPIGLGALIALYGRLKSMRSHDGRQQLKIVMIGLATSYMFVLLMAPLRTYFPRTSAVNIASGLAVMASAAAYLIALIRYRLYDADAVIGRSAVLGALTAALLGIFAGSEKIIEVLGEQYLGDEAGALAAGLAAGIAAVMIVPIHQKVSRWAEHRFQKNLTTLKRDLPVLVGDLRETSAPAQVAATVLDRVSEGVRATRAVIIVHGSLAAARGIDLVEAEAWLSGWSPAERGGLDCAPDDSLLPVRVPLEADGVGRVGWLLLGPRPDGSLYGKDERVTLVEIAEPVARAVEIARTRAERELSQHKWRSGIEEALAHALRRLTALERAEARTAE